MSAHEVLASNRSGALILRLIAASMVFSAHASLAFQEVHLSLELWGQIFPVAEIGLLIFFGLSGILIAVSADSSNFAQFAIRRFKRIYPGLTFMIIFTGLFLGPFIAGREGMSLDEFFSPKRHLGLEYLATPLYIFATSPGAFMELVVNPNMP